MTGKYEEGGDISNVGQECSYTLSREIGVETVKSGGTCRRFWRSEHRGALVVQKYSVPTIEHVVSWGNIGPL